MIIFSALLLASTFTLAFSQKGYSRYDIRRDTAYVCNDASKWPNSIALPPDREACSGAETVFIDHEEGQSTITSSTVSSPPNGTTCATLSAVTDREKIKKIKREFTELALQINDASNVLLVENALWSVVSQIIAGVVERINPFKSANFDITMAQAVFDYLIETEKLSKPFAEMLDQAIASFVKSSNLGTASRLSVRAEGKIRGKIKEEWAKVIGFAKIAQKVEETTPSNPESEPQSKPKSRLKFKKLKSKLEPGLSILSKLFKFFLEMLGSCDGLDLSCF
ncbi:hypothetical protein BD779DRAFT_1799287 [Infundibulicybe gibba]|nr:hypothetical protein BD779DRAFT_1799287 [Infundibulicybe gibba]